MTVVTRPQIVEAQLMLIARMGRCPYCWLCCLYKLPIRRLCITANRSLFNECSYKTTNCWRSVDDHFNQLSIQYLLPSMIVVIMIWTSLLSVWEIKTLPFGKAERSNILALFTLTWLKFIYLAKRFIVPTIDICINRCSQATTYHSPIIYL